MKYIKATKKNIPPEKFDEELKKALELVKDIPGAKIIIHKEDKEK